MYCSHQYLMIDPKKGAKILGLGMQIPEIPAQRKFVSATCHAHLNANKMPTNFKKS